MAGCKFTCLMGGLVCVLAANTAAVNIQTVRVGDPGNAADNRWIAPFGSVSHTYHVGKYEVTASQYAAFLNAVARTDSYGLYNTGMADATAGSGIARTGSDGSYAYSVDSAFLNRPVNYVSFWDACRFANWLHNGQPAGTQGPGTTETGAYTLTTTGVSTNTVARNDGWNWAVASEDEWYKAAYYKGGSIDAGYWDYPTRSNTDPGRDLDDAYGNNANYSGNPFPIQEPYYTTTAGEFQNSASAYGTFDQGGNLWEWNEAITQPYRRVRGGCFLSSSPGYMKAGYRSYRDPSYEDSVIGFRVVAAPEPNSVALVLLSGMIFLRRGRH